jgi:hypothetical protein
VIIRVSPNIWQSTFASERVKGFCADKALLECDGMFSPKNWENKAKTLEKLVVKPFAFRKKQGPESTTRGWWRALFSGCGMPVRKPVWPKLFQKRRKTGEQSHPRFSHTENPTAIQENNLTPNCAE